MQNKKKESFYLGIFLFLSFMLFTIVVRKVDVQPIGPHDSKVGLATINHAVFHLFKVNLLWYQITEWLGLSVLFVALGFSLLGLVQLIKKTKFIQS